MIVREDNKRTLKQIDFLIGNQYVSDNSTVANSFNNYFINIGSSLSKNINLDIDPLIFLQTNANSLYIPQITCCEVVHVISNMNNSAAGYDELPSSIMKKCVETYVQPLTFLINISISQGTFPNEQKIARVIPLPKGKDIQSIKNYRPTIFEKVMFTLVTDFLEEITFCMNINLGFEKIILQVMLSLPWWRE